MPAPPFQLTDTILGQLLEIERQLGRLEGLEKPVPEPRLRRKNRIRTVQGSVAIEGNTLSLEQVTAVLEGKRVAGPSKEVREVRNALRAYEASSGLPPWSTATVLRAHRLLMEGLVPDAGRWRKGDVGVFRGRQVRHVAPPASRVPGLMDGLVRWLRTERRTPALVKACLAHYELQFIHPFTDGNGRVGRLWQHLALGHESPVFGFVPVESLVRQRQRGYYDALAKSDAAGDSTAFIEFMLGCLLAALDELAGDFRRAPNRPADRKEQARAALGSRWFGRKEYRALFRSMSTAAASRDLHAAVEEGQLESRGRVAMTRYRFRRSRPR